MRTYSIYNETFRQNFHLYQGSVKEMLKLFPDEGFLGSGRYWEDEISEGVVALCIWVRPNEEKSTETLCHEAVHAAVRTLQTRGIEVNHDAGEVLAYLVEWLMSKLLEPHSYRTLKKVKK